MPSESENKQLQQSTDEGVTRSIPSLDGLRAFSVLAVILAHTESRALDHFSGSIFLRDSEKGVACFFVLSGFLITHLLLKEQKRSGGIALKRFYLRRTFRIFPPFYAFLVVISFLALLHKVSTSIPDLVAAATYTWNYTPRQGTWILAHTWSLSLEEQFYLLWPACMAYLSRRSAVRLAVCVILLSPLSRLVTYFAFPNVRFHGDMMLHTHLDTMMVGCLLALIIEAKVWAKYSRFVLSPIMAGVALFFLLIVDTLMKARWKGLYLLPIGYSLENFAIGIVMLFSIFRHQSLLGRLLNFKILRYLGRISYSLYLWQQLFTGPYTRSFPLNLIWIFAAAQLSYLLVERPSFLLRDRLRSSRMPAFRDQGNTPNRERIGLAEG